MVEFSSNAAGSSGTAASTTNTAVSFPAAEGNFSVGLGDLADFNVHLSNAGFQPGIKIALLRGPVQLAVMPQASILVVSGGALGTSSTASSSTLGLGILTGVKVLMSLDAGLFAGIGYDFQYASFGLAGASSSSVSSTSTVTAHTVTMNVGWSVKLGALQLRPEVALAITPALTSNSGGAGSSSTTGPIYAFMPGLSVSVEKNVAKAVASAAD